MEDLYESFGALIEDFEQFAAELTRFVSKTLHLQFIRFEAKKGTFVAALYKQRGRLARRLVHSGMAGLAALGVAIAPVIAQEFPGRDVDPWEVPTSTAVLSAASENPETSTFISDVRGEVVEYTVGPGDTVSTIAEKFGILTDTIRWENDLGSRDTIKEGQVLRILPITGIRHTVKKGDTIYSIAKKYDVDAQVIVNYPFNSYSNDETFDLAIGQVIIVPDGVPPKEAPTAPRIRQITPDAGTVVASGRFVWPVSGSISQNFVWYHKGLDISNKAAPNILAADAGTIVGAGWLDNYGYGNRVVIDHGNGFRTLYAHMAAIYVVPGQTVARGSAIGKMGSTGRSTGIHLHFEVIKNGVYLNPLSVLQ